MLVGWVMVNSDGMPVNRNMFALYEGFKELGIEVKTYTPADVFTNRIPVDKENMVVGHIAHCRRHVLKITGKDVPVIDYPQELTGFLGREINKSTVGEVYNHIVNGDEYGFFMKPVSQKLFTGFVCRTFADFFNNCGGVDKDEPVYVSGFINFASEYRAYIHRHSLVACLRYKGDYSAAPDKSRVEEMLYALRNANMPIAYSIDVGITTGGYTCLVECNDGFALGNYGMDSRTYAEMHRDRWNQLVERVL